MALKALWVYLLIAIARLTELIPGMSDIPLAKIAIGICVVGVLGRSELWSGVRVLSLPVARVGLGLLAVAVISPLFSVWRGHSAAYLLSSVLPVVAGFVLTVKLINNARALRATFMVLVVCGLIQACYALTIPGQFMMGFDRISAGTSYDPNDLAYLLVTVFPLSLAFRSLAATRFWRLAWLVSSGVLVVGTLLTQSRGGFLALLAIMCYLVFHPLPGSEKSTRRRKRGGAVFAAMLAALVASAAVWMVLPNDTRDRLSTILHPMEDYNADRSVKTGRLDIWMRSVDATIKRPIGYGIDSFGVVDMRTGGRFKAPHNSLVEVFVELGFLGLFLYLRAYRLAWRGLSSPSNENPDGWIFCRALRASLLGNFVAGFFLSQAYTSLPWTLLAVAAIAGAVLARPAEAASPRAVAVG